MALDFAKIRTAHERIRAHIRRTPILTSTRLDEVSGASLFFKCENFQKVGAFKARGVESYGAHIVFCEPTQAAREAACADVIAKTGATLIHSFKNEDVMAGQGTAAIELLEEVDVDLVICPIGGGGLLCGTAVAAKSMR